MRKEIKDIAVDNEMIFRKQRNQCVNDERELYEFVKKIDKDIYKIILNNCTLERAYSLAIRSRFKLNMIAHCIS